jgi:diacylglycerol kinase (ATP)
MARRTLFIINPAAGGRQALQRWALFEQKLSAAGIAVDKVLTQFPGHAEQIAAQAAQDYDVLAVVGGDGTVSEVANGILQTSGDRATLGIVPCGTGNDIARNCGIRNLTHSLDSLSLGQVRQMDAIRIDCRAKHQPLIRFGLAFGGVGIIGPLLRYATVRAKRVLGQTLAYRVALLRALWAYRSPQMQLSCDGTALKGRFLFLGLSNGEAVGGGMKLAPGARIDDGLLNVNLVDDLPMLEGIKQIRRLSQGRHTDHEKVRYFTAKAISVGADEPVDVATDGEIIGTTPARFEVKPGALRLLVPRGGCPPPSGRVPICQKP